MAGNPTKLTARRTAAICKSIARGSPEEAAALAADIHPATLYRWKERGEAALEAESRGETLTAQDELAARFCEGIEKARGECEEGLIRVVTNAAHGTPAEYDDDGRLIRAEQRPDWKAAMTALERRWPTRWARRLKVSDETPRPPAPLHGQSVAEFEERFRAAFGDDLDVDTSQLMPGMFDTPSSSNGSSGNGSGP